MKTLVTNTNEATDTVAATTVAATTVAATTVAATTVAATTVAAATVAAATVAADTEAAATETETNSPTTITLALDTSGSVASVAVLRTDETDGESVLARESVGDGMRHGVDLFPAMERVLAAAALTVRDVRLVAVGTGPGSYTGLRVGISAARAIAYATGARLLGVPSCDAWAAAIPPDDRLLAVVLDAKVKAVYLALYRNDGRAWLRYEGPELMQPQEAAARLPARARVIGDGVTPYADAFGARTAEAAPELADAALIARLALARDARGERDPIEQIVPLYLRRTEAELRLEARHG